MLDFELRMLGFSALLGLIHIVAAEYFARKERGSRRADRSIYEPIAPLHGTAGRLARALENFSATFPLFATLALAVAVSGRGSLLSEWGAGLYFAARVLYLPMQVFGLPVLRSLAWTVALLGIVLLVLALLWG